MPAAVIGPLPAALRDELLTGPRLLRCCRYGIFPAESVHSRVQRAKADPTVALGHPNRCQHSKCCFLPELINAAADTLGSEGEAIRRFTAVQQRFGFTLHQLREGCRAVCSPSEDASGKLVPGSGVTVQQLAEVLQQFGLLQASGT
jgi:hypothetical protein